MDSPELQWILVHHHGNLMVIQLLSFGGLPSSIFWKFWACVFFCLFSFQELLFKKEERNWKERKQSKAVTSRGKT
jgi:hypothetical protein